jgi:hypothetical protein
MYEATTPTPLRPTRQVVTHQAGLRAREWLAPAGRLPVLIAQWRIDLR